jgi:hypothetical protein
VIAALLFAVQADALRDFEVLPSELAWEEVEAGPFDQRWILPEAPAAGRDLLAEMRRLAQLRFTADLGSGPEEARLGDLVRAARALDGEARRAWFAELERRAPRLVADWGEGLAQLLLDDQLLAEDWDPTEDLDRDGLLIAEEWELGEELGEPWSELAAEPRLAQAAALFLADLATIKEVENDYRAYPDNPGSDYEFIQPQRERYFRGSCPDGRPFSAPAIEFRCDLPFPFSTYYCDLRILNRIDDDGLVRTDIYSTSDDFHYLAGRDVFLPVRDSAGEEVAFLVVRHFGFDLRGVPDRSRHRREGVRASLGNLKRNAERRYRAAGESFGPVEDAITGFRVRGRAPE